MKVFEEILADPSIDAIEILTPQHLHKSTTLVVLRSGKHIHVQKTTAV